MDAEMRQMFELVLSKLDTLEKRMDSMEERMGSMEIRQGEIYDVVKAIEHSNQVHKAEMDNINIRTSHIEGTINAVGDAINKRMVI